MSGEPEGVEFRELARRVASRRALIIAVAVVTFGSVAAFTFLVTPRYESRAVLRIANKADAPSMPAGLQSLPGAGLLGLDRDELETEVGVLRSRMVVDAAIDSLGLMIRLMDPPQDRASLYTVRVVDSTDAKGDVTLTREADGKYRVSSSGFADGGGPSSAPSGGANGGAGSSVAPGDSLRVGPAVLRLNPALATAGPATIELRLLPRYKVREWFDKRLTIKRQEGGSRLVEASYEDPDRRLAQQVVRRMVAEFIGYTQTMEAREDGHTITDLRGEVDGATKRLASADAALTEFQQRSRLVLPQEQATAQIKRIAALDAQLDQLGVERAALEKVLALVSQRSASGTDSRAYRQLATFPSLIANKAIQDLLQTLIELGNKRSEMALRRTTDNEDYRQITSRTTELEQQLFRLTGQYLESLDQQMSTTSRAVTVLTDTLQAMPAVEGGYVRLVRARAVASEEYLALRRQLKLAELAELLRKERIRVIDAPRVADVRDKAFPRRSVFLALGAVLAVTLALSVGLAAEVFSAGAASPRLDE